MNVLNAVPQPPPSPGATPAPVRGRFHRIWLPLIMMLLFILSFFVVSSSLAVAYLVAGHAIMRAAHPSPHSMYRAPLASSAVAGAEGGLFIPVVIIFGLVACLNGINRDNTISTARRRFKLGLRWAGIAICVIAFFAAGGIAGPLCISGQASAGRSATPAQQAAARAAYNKAIAEGKHLSIRAAAAAGFVGGAVVGPGLVVVGVLIMLAWRRRPKALTDTPFLELAHRAPPRGIYASVAAEAQSPHQYPLPRAGAPGTPAWNLAP